MHDGDPPPASRQSRRWLPVALGVVAVSGILGALALWPRQPELVTVTGKILYGGIPLSNGFVVCFPSSGGESALSALDDEGGFDLATNGVPGAAVGTHRLTVQAYTREMPPQPRIPAKYTSEKSTPLRILVKKGEPNHFQFQLEETASSPPRDAGSNP